MVSLKSRLLAGAMAECQFRLIKERGASGVMGRVEPWAVGCRLLRVFAAAGTPSGVILASQDRCRRPAISPTCFSAFHKYPGGER